MGCGASKSVQVAGTDITTSPKPPPPFQSTSAADGIQASSSAQNSPSTSASPATQSSSIHAPASPAKKPSGGTGTSGEHSAMESTVAERTHPGVASSSATNDRYAAFEVDMGDRVSTAPPPRILKKLADTPKVSAKMLAEKEKSVQERKVKELEKRANSRLSKKERLRREIMEARKMGNTDIEPVKEEENNDRRNYGDGAVEMEVDQTYNDDMQIGDWEGEGEGVAQSSHDPTVSTTATRQEVPTNTQERTTITTEPFGDWDSANSLS